MKRMLRGTSKRILALEEEVENLKRRLDNFIEIMGYITVEDEIVKFSYDEIGWDSSNVESDFDDNLSAERKDPYP